jgi:hypothetical protein
VSALPESGHGWTIYEYTQDGTHRVAAALLLGYTWVPTVTNPSLAI